MRAPSRGSTHVSFFFVAVRVYFFFRLIIIIRCREDLEAGARRVKAYLGKYVIDVIDYTSRALLNQYKIKTLSCACPLQPAALACTCRESLNHAHRQSVLSRESGAGGAHVFGHEYHAQKTSDCTSSQRVYVGVGICAMRARVTRSSCRESVSTSCL